MAEIVGALSAMTVAELVTLLTTLAALIIAMERLVRAFAVALEALVQFVQLLLQRDYQSSQREEEQVLK